MNKKSYLIILLICGVILSALVVRNGRLILLALPFLVYLIVGLIQAPTELRLVAHRIINKSSISAHKIVDTRIVVTNQGNLLVNLFLIDPLFSGLTILEGAPHQRLSIAAGETIELNYTFTAERGVYTWETIRACAADPFGLFELEEAIPAAGNLLVRPAPLQIRSLTMQPQATLPAAGPILARKAGLGTDFWGIREYRTGDSFRRINWRLAARHRQKFFTNEYEREEIADFGLILDARKRTNADEMESALFEHSVSAVAELGKTFLRNGNRVSLLVIAKSILTTFPGSGKQQLDLLQWNLARAKLSGNLSLVNIKHFPTRLFPVRSLMVVFSPVSPRDLKGYARLRSFGYDVILISPDPVKFAAQYLPLTKTNTLAFRAARVERVLQLKRLMNLGVNVIDWQVDQPLDPLVQDTARHLIHRRNI